MNVKRLAVAALALVLSFCLRVPNASAAQLDITGEWYWACSPTGATSPGGIPEGQWSGKFTLSKNTSGGYTGTFAGSQMEDISFDGETLTFTRIILTEKDKNESNTQMWTGRVTKKGARLVFDGSF